MFETQHFSLMLYRSKMPAGHEIINIQKTVSILL